jgi:TatD DNase family protein
VLAAIAIHPNEAPRLHATGELDQALAALDEMASQPRVVAIGETGLDFFRTPEPMHEVQREAFRAHIALAKKHDLALQIHDRDAHQDVVDVLLEVGAPRRTVFHCYSGDAVLARVLADNGWYASFSGTVTFKNSEGIRDALALLPRSQILVETDTPFLTPTPFRGRPNSPYMIPYTLRSMAGSLGMDESLLAAQLRSNTFDVYGRWDDEPLASTGSLYGL